MLFAERSVERSENGGGSDNCRRCDSLHRPSFRASRPTLRCPHLPLHHLPNDPPHHVVRVEGFSQFGYEPLGNGIGWYGGHQSWAPCSWRLTLASPNFSAYRQGDPPPSRDLLNDLPV